MAFQIDLRILIASGAVLAVVAGGGVAYMAGLHDKAPHVAPASQGGLVVQMGVAEEGRLDAAKPLRCFVAGKFVGELTLAQCASRNGVAAGALDVGVDASGALAAADQAGTDLAPLPPAETDQGASADDQKAQGAQAACWRYENGQWARLPGESGQDQCVEALYAGRCEPSAGAAYGRWGDQTLRLTAGRIEISPDNRRFRTIAVQPPGCSATGDRDAR